MTEEQVNLKLGQLLNRKVSSCSMAMTDWSVLLKISNALQICWATDFGFVDVSPRGEPGEPMSLKKQSTLISILTSSTDLKRIETPHCLFCGFRKEKPFTTCWSELGLCSKIGGLEPYL